MAGYHSLFYVTSGIVANPTPVGVNAEQMGELRRRRWTALRATHATNHELSRTGPLGMQVFSQILEITLVMAQRGL
jgi:hypothetical protein